MWDKNKDRPRSVELKWESRNKPYICAQLFAMDYKAI